MVMRPTIITPKKLNKLGNKNRKTIVQKSKKLPSNNNSGEYSTNVDANYLLNKIKIRHLSFNSCPRKLQLLLKEIKTVWCYMV